MKDKKLFPIIGMNNVASDTSLSREQGNYVRMASNIDIQPSGQISVRKDKSKASDDAITSLWQSPLHKDVFGLEDGNWVKINTDNWQREILCNIGDEPLYHIVLNNRVVVSGKKGLFEYDGITAKPLTIDTPIAPIATANTQSKPLTAQIQGIDGDTYRTTTRVLALSYLVGDKESGLSNNISIDGDEVTVTLPIIHPSHVTHINLYSSEQGGSELKLVATLPIDTKQYTFDNHHVLGKSAEFKHLSPMKQGKYLTLWRGRLLSVHGNVIRFSEPLAYHLTDERYNYITLPQRVSFIVATDGGLWVGQTTGVLFLNGDNPNTLTVSHKSGKAPISGSAIAVDNDMSADISNGGQTVALWLSENGYCMGTADGQLIERHANILQGITAKDGCSVVVGQRVFSALI